MDKKDKFMVAGLIIVLLFIFINIFSTIHTMDDYEARKESRKRTLATSREQDFADRRESK